MTIFEGSILVAIGITGGLVGGLWVLCGSIQKLIYDLMFRIAMLEYSVESLAAEIKTQERKEADGND